MGVGTWIGTITIWLLASSCLSVYLTVHVQQFGPYAADYHEIWYVSIFQKSVGKVQILLKSDKNNGNFTQANNIFKKSCLYKVMWKNILEPARQQMTKWRMHIACWMAKATYRHSEYVMLIAFPLQQWLN